MPVKSYVIKISINVIQNKYYALIHKMKLTKKDNFALYRRFRDNILEVKPVILTEYEVFRTCCIIY